MKKIKDKCRNEKMAEKQAGKVVKFFILECPGMFRICTFNPLFHLNPLLVSYRTILYLTVFMGCTLWKVNLPEQIIFVDVIRLFPSFLFFNVNIFTRLKF